ncbi:2-keto-4-pentenoate hydratase [Bailinhaonella thermotolerans]|uniref:4-oxalocrotonate decarboxylase n=1 Tax=Bailinhaonella thermotolerans TaxID=1070861 RepID=A0A3A4AS28_9ACTN|nr:fumarylacetoacetate hydrolase family protein [Bailinhaonella thermotolerans]RJL31399.1 4-oxalocrotonate decarboxylase [Bailinhaonella thermotolerans]
MIDPVELAARLDEAARTPKAVPQPEQAFDVSTAYAAQRELLALRQARGERLAGVKMGFTSRAKMAQMGVSDLIWGRLTDAMRVPDGGTIDLSAYVHPRVEPEVAFLLGEGGSVEAVAPALEIIDSRYEDFRFSLESVIADNASSSGFVLGPWSPVPEGLENLGVVMSFDGVPVQVGSTAAILGDPRRALAGAVRLTRDAGLALEPGWVVLAGAATAAEALRPGVHVRAEVARLGAVEFSVEAS